MAHITRVSERTWAWVVCVVALVSAAAALGAAEPPTVVAKNLPARQDRNQVRMTVWKVAWGGPKNPHRLRIDYTLDDLRFAAALRGDWALDRASVSRPDGTPLKAEPVLGQDRVEIPDLDQGEREIVLTVRAYDRKAPKHALGLFEESLRFQRIALPTGDQPVAVGATLKTALDSAATVRAARWWRPKEGQPRLALVCAADPPPKRPDIEVRLAAPRDAVIDDRGKQLEVERVVAGDLFDAAKQAPALVTVLCRRQPTTTATSLTLTLTLQQHLAERENPECFRAFSFQVAVPPPD
jgi:hypothetical protein